MSKKEESKESQTDLQKLLADAQKSFPKSFVGLGNSPDAVLEKIPSGIDVFDAMIGGGLIRGRLHLFAGGFGSGKTYISQKVIESAQKLGGKCVYIDAEKRFDPAWFKLTGVDVENLILARPNYGEEALDMVIFYLKQKVDVVIIDSLAALVPMQEEADSMEQQSIGIQARMLNKAFRKITPINDRTALIAINQQRQTIGNVYTRGVQKTMPGGEGQYYYASLIVDVRRGEYKKDKNDERVGHEINCVVSKCNFYPPFGKCIIPLVYKTGQVDTMGIIINLAIDYDIIKKKAGWYYIEGEEKPEQGIENVIQFYKENPDKFQVLRNAVVAFDNK